MHLRLLAISPSLGGALQLAIALSDANDTTVRLLRIVMTAHGRDLICKPAAKKHRCPLGAKKERRLLGSLSMSLRNANTHLSSSSLQHNEEETCSGRLDVGEEAASESDSLSNKNAKSCANSRSSRPKTLTHEKMSNNRVHFFTTDFRHLV